MLSVQQEVTNTVFLIFSMTTLELKPGIPTAKWTLQLLRHRAAIVIAIGCDTKHYAI